MRLFFLFFVLSVNLAISQDIDYSSVTISNELRTNANAVVRYNYMHVELLSIKEMKVRYERVVTVFNESGNQHVQAGIGYNKSLKVKNAQAVIYDSFGEELDKKKQKDFIDVSAVDGGTLYSDSRKIFLGYTPIQYPYTISFSYEIITENTGTIPSWSFVDGFMVSTEKSEYILDFYLPSLKPNILEKNFEGYKIKKSENSKSISYTAENILAIKKENLSPSFGKITPRIMISPINFHYEGFTGEINNWKDVGNWMQKNLLHKKDELPPATISKIKSLVSNAENDLEKAKIVYDYVQRNTRYISVQVGIGGLQPVSALEVDRLKYGDCKGLSNYTKALLKTVGVTAYYTHVEAGWDKVSFESDFPSIGQGNHVILAVSYEGNYYWIDCTSQVHPFGFIGDFTDERKVMIIKPDGGEVVTTTSYLNEYNYQKTVANISLGEQGDFTSSVDILTQGIQYDNRFFLENESDLDLEKYYKYYWSNINNLDVKSHQFKNNKEEVKFNENLEITAIKYATIVDDKLLVIANMFNNNQYVPDRYRNRKLPFELQRGYLDEDQYIINKPEGYAVEALPRNIIITNKYGEYEVSYVEEGDQIIFNRRLLIKKGKYPNTEYNDYRNFRKEISKHDNSKIVLNQL